MKKFLIVSMAVGMVFFLDACKFDDYEARLDYTVVYFPHQSYIRNVVVGEGLGINVGITMGGRIYNESDRSVTYTIDHTIPLEVGETYLPANYYTMGDPSRITIPVGSVTGYVGVKLDSALFVSDPGSLTGEYVLPVRIETAPGFDSISEGKDYMKISISYFAKQHGNYYYRGTTERTKNGVTEKVRHANLANETESVRKLKTVAANRMKVVADQRSNDPANGKYSFIVEVPVHGGGSVSVMADPDSAIEVQPNGDSRYDLSSRTFILNYKYTTDDNTACEVADTMVFRNRIRDDQGNNIFVNEFGNRIVDY